jgi:hypothetical protein
MPDPTARIRAGRTVRFQVQHPELGRGSSWSVTSHKRTGDIYVAHREGGQWIKSSYHQTGQWHWGLGAAAIAREQDAMRYLAITHTHREIASGWEHALRITVPRTELRHYTEQVTQRPVIPVSLPWGHDAVAIDLYIGKPGHSIALRIDPHTRVLADMERGDEGRALIVKRPLQVDRPVHEEFEAEIREAREGMTAQGWDGRPTRIVIFGMTDPEGPHQELEVAIDSVT